MGQTQDELQKLNSDYVKKLESKEQQIESKN